MNLPDLKISKCYNKYMLSDVATFCVCFTKVENRLTTQLLLYNFFANENLRIYEPAAEYT